MQKHGKMRGIVVASNDGVKVKAGRRLVRLRARAESALETLPILRTFIVQILTSIIRNADNWTNSSRLPYIVSLRK